VCGRRSCTARSDALPSTCPGRWTIAPARANPALPPAPQTEGWCLGSARPVLVRPATRCDATRRLVEDGVGGPIFTRNVAGCMRNECDRYRSMGEVMAYGTERDETRQGQLRVLQVRHPPDPAKQGIHAEGLSELWEEAVSQGW
jgi:hypothetical protein